MAQGVRLEVMTSNVTRPSSYTLYKNKLKREDGGEIGRSGVNFPPHLGETPSHSTEKKANSQKQPSVYEDRRPKSTEDTEKTEGKGIDSGQKGPWDQCGDQGGCSPRPTHAGPAAGLLGESRVNGPLPCQTRTEQHCERPSCLKLLGGE